MFKDRNNGLRIDLVNPDDLIACIAWTPQ